MRTVTFNANVIAYYLDSERYSETLRRESQEQSLLLMHSCRIRKRRKAV